MLDERRKRSFAPVADHYMRTKVEKDVLESLIKGGFLESIFPSGSREGLLAAAREHPKKPKSAGLTPPNHRQVNIPSSMRVSTTGPMAAPAVAEHSDRRSPR